MRPDYNALEQYLRGKTDSEVTLTFAQIEKIVGTLLPASSVEHRAWWGNQEDTTRHAHKRAWKNAGFKVTEVYQHRHSGWVKFSRNGSA